MTNRQKLSIGLWILALAIWLVAGLTGSIAWWVTVVVAAGFGLQVINAVMNARRQPRE